MKKIVILVVYFGEWPKWFRIFLETCRHNERIEWMFFTDCKVPKSTPDNAKFEKMTLKEFEDLASSKTGIGANIERPYKVCDFRPAFAKIFEDYIVDYDFWGWGDIDVLYGNLNHIFDPRNLKKYDIISVRRRRTAGAMTVFKNTEDMKMLFKKSPDYKRVFGSSVGYAFDESGKFKDRSVFSITDVINKYRKEMNIRHLFWDYAKNSSKLGNGSIDIYWENGRMYDVKQGGEVFLYHFLDRKKDPSFTVQREINTSNGFFAGEGGIREADPHYSVDRNPLFTTVRRVKDKMRWVKDQVDKIKTDLRM